MDRRSNSETPYIRPPTATIPSCGAVTSIFAGERNTFENFSGEMRAVTNFDQPINFVLGGYYQNWNRFFDQDVIFAFLPSSVFPTCAQGTAGACGPQYTGPLDDPNDEFTAYNKISETDGETLSAYGEIRWDITGQGLGPAAIWPPCSSKNGFLPALSSFNDTP